MVYIIAQIIGLIAFVISLVAYHRNKKEKILGNMVVSNVLNLVHYLLLGAFSGCFTKIMAILRDGFIILKGRYKFLSSNWFIAIFYMLYVIAGILTYTSIWSLFPIIAAVIYMTGIWNGSELFVKKIGCFCNLLWLIYNIFVLSLSGIASNIISIISTLIAIKNDKTKLVS